jgi:hypothetical protein
MTVAFLLADFVCTSAALATCTSSVLPTPNVGFNQNWLSGISGTSGSDIWAVGWYDHDGGYQTLIEHFDGTSWSIVPSPNDPKHLSSLLYGVSGFSSTDAWAVGTTTDCPTCTNRGRPFAVHWDGSAWTEVAVPRDGPTAQYLSGVSVDPANPDDVWMVGWVDSTGIRGETTGIYSEHWNGRRFKIIGLPGSNALVYGVTTAPDGEAWVVATGYNGNGWSIQHWDGAAWTQQASGRGNDHVNAVSAIAPNDVWAVGDVIELFNGTTWQSIAHPGPKISLDAVSALSTNDAWAAGTNDGVFRWDGIRWAWIPQPPHTDHIAFSGIQALPNGAITAGVEDENDLTGNRTYSTITACTN